MIGGFAHDFSNILATIVLNLNLIEKKCSDPTAAWFASGALRAADRGANLANRLLAFSGKQKLSRAPTDLDALISGMRDLLLRTTGPEVEVIVSSCESAWPASIDRDQVEFALINLVENARDAMPRGGQLAIETSNTQIAAPVPDLAPGDYIVLALEDTGEGLSEEAMERAFEPFFSTRRGHEHPGLGLSAVLGIAKAHGGSARVMRAAGGGCRVEIYLPRATRAEIRAAADLETVPPPAREAANTTVLVVDDNPDLLAVVQEGLAGLGCDVLLADSGSAALEVLASRPLVDLLLVDVTMAGMDGLELMRRAREMRPGLKALFMTGGGEIPGLRKAEEPMPALLRKPFRTADLARALAAVMSGDTAR
ncbi:MAG: ATP-binding protein [Stellaceae bacterium]